MNNEKLEKIRAMFDVLRKEHITMLEMNIINELDSQLMYMETYKDLTDDEYNTLYNEIEYAYLKLEGVALESVVTCAIDNMNKILDEEDDTFSLREEACWY